MSNAKRSRPRCIPPGLRPPPVEVLEDGTLYPSNGTLLYPSNGTLYPDTNNPVTKQYPYIWVTTMTTLPAPTFDKIYDIIEKNWGWFFMPSAGVMPMTGVHLVLAFEDKIDLISVKLSLSPQDK